MTTWTAPATGTAYTRTDGVRSEAGRRAFAELYAVEQLTSQRRASGLPWRVFFERLGEGALLLPPGTIDRVLHRRHAIQGTVTADAGDRPSRHNRDV